MGTDLFTSSRGPGLIGTLLALVVLVGFGVLYMFVFDERFQGGGQTLESIIEEDARQLSRLEERLADHSAKLDATKGFKEVADDLRSETVRHGVAAERRKKLEADVAEATRQFEEFEASVETYRQAYRESARASMVGREFDELKTTDGRTYRQVKVTDIDPVRMQIRHRGGITGVALEILPDDLKDYLQFDEQEKTQRLAAETAERDRQTNIADQSDIVERIKNMRYRLGEVTRKRDEAERLAQSATSAIPQLEQAILLKKDELQREELKARTGGISNAPQVRAQLTKLEGQLQYAREQSPVLRAKVEALDQEVAAIEGDIEAARAELQRRQSGTDESETGESD